MSQQNLAVTTLRNFIPREYFDPFYTPMSAASAYLLETLYEALTSDPENSSIAYHQYLYQCKLDFSLASLERLDKLLSAIKKQRPIQRSNLVDEPKLNKFFIVLITYVGEVFSRARGQAALWFAREEIKDIGLLTNQPQPTSLWFPDEDVINDRIWSNISLIEQSAFFIVLFSRDKKTITLDNVEYFLPVHPILNMLVGDQTYPLYDYVINNLKAFNEQLPSITAIPQQPIISIDVGLKQKLQNLQQHQRYYLQVRKPTWVKESAEDPLFKQIKALGSLYKRGKVVWAALVQANESLFSPRDRNKFASLGEVIYDPTGRTHIRELLNLANKLNNLKNTKPLEADQLTHVQRLTNESEAVSGANFPKSLSSLPIKVSSIFFWRRHLPNGFLSQTFFPILISEECEDAIAVLPSRFWSEEFVEAWLAAAREEFNGSDFNIMPKLLEKEENHLPAWTLSTSVSPEEFRKSDLFPELTDLFPDHIYPEELIKVKSDQPINSEFDPSSLQWIQMLHDAEKAPTEEERQRLIEEARKYNSENFITGTLRRDGVVKITSPRKETLSETQKALEEQMELEKYNRDIDQFMENLRRKDRKTTIAPEYKILICVVIALFLIKLFS